MHIYNAHCRVNILMQILVSSAVSCTGQREESHHFIHTYSYTISHESFHSHTCIHTLTRIISFTHTHIQYHTNHLIYIHAYSHTNACRYSLAVQGEPRYTGAKSIQANKHAYIHTHVLAGTH